jgi:hypothetical protein
MARQRNEQADVESVEETDTTPEGTETEVKEPKAKKEPQRGNLPEGYVTPVGFAHELGKQGLQKDRDGNVLTEVRPQMVYSYIKNAPASDKFPIEEVTDDIGKQRPAFKLQDGLDWWARKNERVAAKKTNAAEKQAKKDAAAAAKATASEAGVEETEAVEAE